MKHTRTLILLHLALLNAITSIARVGGAGGHGSHSGGGHGGFSSHGGGGYVGSGGGENMSPSGIIVLIVIAIIIYIVYQNMKKKMGSTGGGLTGNMAAATDQRNATAFPEGLGMDKVVQAFHDIQNAWQRKDLKGVRKWISDGVYQRLTAQFKMMEALGQSNRLSNITILNVSPAGISSDGAYDIAEMAITFSMNDEFRSEKYPQFNESYPADEDTEYWTFIRRKDAARDKNLYDNASCPNCGAPFEQKMGEISRCANCGTLTNSAAYDWVLSEITQDEDWRGGAGMAGNGALRTVMAGDPLFAVQRAEDIASNVAMQIFEVLAGESTKKLARFANEQTAQKIIAQKTASQPFVFDRLYLNEVTLSNYDVDSNGIVHLHFSLSATYRRASIAQQIYMLDDDFVTQRFTMTLSRKAAPVAGPATGETVYSYECSSCGAPFGDTTEDRCTYCDAPVVDAERNWVLTAFSWR